MSSHRIGRNSRDKWVHVYYQLCPTCLDPVIGYRETDNLIEFGSDVHDLMLLTKQSG
jgi:hypothetical protein